MTRRLRAWWRDESGATSTDMMIALGLLAIAGALWYSTFAGETDVSRGMKEFGRRARKAFF
jgi:Flp pilus assembly pilin Flp